MQVYTDNSISITPVANGYVVTLPFSDDNAGIGFDPNKLFDKFGNGLKRMMDTAAGDEILANVAAQVREENEQEEKEQKLRTLMRNNQQYIFGTFGEALSFLADFYKNPEGDGK